MEKAIAKWLEDEEVRNDHHSRPPFVMWPIWIVKNEDIFEGKLYTLVKILYKIQHNYTA